jgi:hypothetical protein
VLLAADVDEHFIQGLLVIRLWPALLQHVGKGPTKVQAPLTNALIADDNPARRQDQLDFAPIRSSYPLDFGDVVVIHSYPLDSGDAKFGLW